MQSEPVITPSAYKHGIVEDDILHAFRNPMFVHPGAEGFTMIAGPARDARMLEIGYITSDHFESLIIHAMLARTKYLR